MSSLGPEARSLLDAARHEDDPTPADRARVRARLATRLGAGAMAGTASVGSAKASTASAGASKASALTATMKATVVGKVTTAASAGGKVWLALGAAAALAVGGAGLVDPLQPSEAFESRAHSPNQNQAPAQTREVVRAHAVPPADERPRERQAPRPDGVEPAAPASQRAEGRAAGHVAVQQAIEHEQEPAAGDLRPARPPQTSRPVRSRAPNARTISSPQAQRAASSLPARSPAPAVEGAPSPAPPMAAPPVEVASASAPDSLPHEVRLLSRAQTALQAGRYTQAIELAQQHAERFPEGMLEVERLGVVALARCAQGLPGGDAARRLLHKAPASPMARRVLRACPLR